MSGIFRNPANVIAAGDVSLATTSGDILLKTGVGATVRITINNSGNPAITIDGNCDVAPGHQYLIGGTPVFGSGSAIFVDMETPAGSVDGVNTAFTLAFTPILGTVHLYLNGILQREGIGNDYTISGASITFATAPESGATLLASYRK